jgi:hypothetical protein
MKAAGYIKIRDITTLSIGLNLREAGLGAHGKNPNARNVSSASSVDINYCECVIVLYLLNIKNIKIFSN